MEIQIQLITQLKYWGLKMAVISSRPIEKVISQGKPVFSGKTTAKDFPTWLESRIGVYTKMNNEEYRQVFMSILTAYRHFNPRQEVQVDIKSWRGKSGVEVIKGLDKLTLIRHQKSNKSEEPKEVRYEYTKEELNAIVNSIRRLSIAFDQIETKELAIQYCSILDIRKNDKGEDLFSTGNFWEKFFNWRKAHNSFTTLLAGLEQLELISYSDGKTKLLDKNISVQTLLL
jgi:hypothetical protein